MRAKVNRLQPTFRVRPLQDSDLGSIIAIADRLCSSAFFWPADKLKLQLMAPTSQSFVAESMAADSKTGSSILAFICFVDLGVAVEVPVLGTAMEFQHRGVMKELFSQVIASHYKSRELWLEVHQDNQAARNLYRTLGFVESGLRPKYYRDGSAAILCNRIPL